MNEEAPEAPKAEAPKAEAPKAKAPKAKAPKAEAPKAEAPKAEAPKAEAPKAEAPKADSNPRAAMLFEAEALWNQIIEEPKRGEVSVWITEIFDACGWGNWLRGPHGGCPNGYTRPPDPDWCGLFVAYCGLQVGLDSKIAKSVLPSTYRLHNPKTWKTAGYAKPERPEALEPGDVVVVGNAKPWGTHIVLVAEVGEDSFVTFEGNARGLLRDGRTGKGVVKRTRNLHEAIYVYRIPDECFR